MVLLNCLVCPLIRAVLYSDLKFYALSSWTEPWLQSGSKGRSVLHRL